MNTEKSRGLRGLLIHYRERPATGRRLIKSHLPKERGRCNWCRQAVDEKGKVLWHSSCAQWAEVAFGGYPYAYMRATRDYHCEQCGGADQIEYDHTLSIAVARELGGNAVIRAFCLDNVRYLCHSCHLDKTKRDLALLKSLRKGIVLPIGSGNQVAMPL